VGSYSVEVNALATEHKISSAGFVSDDPVGSGMLTFTSGDNSFDIITSPTDTLAEIRDAINDSDDNEAIVATIITGDDGQHLVLSSKETGVENAITIVVADTGDSNDTDNSGLSRLAYQPDNSLPNFAANLTEVQAASDAQITIDGTLTATSATNTFTNVIDGIDITAKKVHDVDDDLSKAKVTENNNNITSGLNSFIESYNSLRELADNLGSSGESGTGVMAGDSLLRGVMGKIRQELSSSFDAGNGTSLSLSEMGIRADRYGVLSLDSEDLNSFIDDNVDGVQQFFIGTDSAPGFAQSMDDLMSFYTDSDGLIQNRIDSRQSQLEQLDDDKIAFSSRMESLEARLLAQYNAMDLLVAQLNSTSTYVQAQLENMPGVVRNNN
jgi:flagellar hook-associated protein 2